MGVSKRTINYAIIDIETTGGLPKRDKIIEIAIVIHDGTRITDQFSSLINPERSIPYEITRITGIDDAMVEDAPKFYEIAKEIVLRTENTIFVAHNVNFDYSFIKNEFEKLGYTFSKRVLCTVKLSRRAFPGLSSYSLGNLIRHFDIEVNARHRALDDALATAKIFGLIVQKQDKNNLKQVINRGIRETKLPETISMERLHALPETVGVYYFYDVYGNVVYVGKSKDIKSRIMQHFSQINAKSEKLMRLTHDIDYTETGSELIALLLESEEIKLLNPEINKAQKNKDYPYYIYRVINDDYLCFGINKIGSKNSNKHEILSYHSSIQSAKVSLSLVREMYQLCEEKFILLGEKERNCIYFSMGECYGACKNLEDAESYNDRAEEASIYLTKVFDEDMILMVEGRNNEEIGLILIEDRSYKGFGYIAVEDANLGIEEMKEAIENRFVTPESNAIIMQYLNGNTVKKIIKI